MQLLIQSLTLRNFKGLRDLTLNINADVTKVYGKNGAGKSTIADGITYCLFGKDAKGNTQFGLKTRDEEGNEIPHLDHEATLTILLNGTQHTLSRILREKWSKPRGYDHEVLQGNVIDYYIDNEKVTKTDYDKFVFSIAGDEIFRLLTNPSLFPSLHWQDQLTRLNAIIGSITNEDIANGDPRFAQLLKELESQSLEAYRKHLSYQMREIKKALDDYPVKLSTLKNTLPDKLNWIELKSDLLTKQDQLKDLEQQLAEAKVGSDNAQKSAIRHKIDFFQSRIDQMQQSRRLTVRKKNDALDMSIRQAKQTAIDAEELVQQLSRKRKALDTTIDACNQSIRESKVRLASVKEEGTQVYEQRYEVDNNLTVCPTCGQSLPEEQVKEAVERAIASFNETKALRIKELTSQMEGLQNAIKQAEQMKQDNINDMSVIDTQIQSAANDAKKKKDDYLAIKDTQPTTLEEVLANDTEYSNVLSQLADLRSQLDTEPTDINTDALQEQILNTNADISELHSLIATEAQYNKVSDLITKANEQWQQLNTQLTDLERQEDIAKSFSELRDLNLENRVNSLFQFTRFRLYRTQVDGTREPYCTATLNGVEYKDLNSAAKIAVGLDIINALSRYYDVSVPICCDNAESVNQLPDTIGQRIELYVSTNSELTIL